MLTSKKQIAVRTLPVLISLMYSSASISADALEEVIVTAQKRAERIQDVPIAISAISGAQLETRGIEGVANLNSLAPNLMYRDNPASSLVSTLSIRGAATGQPGIFVDPSVGMYVDGVYIGKAQGSIFDIADLERVEILRGPQGTLFGRNTEGGAISFVTRKPSGQFSGSVAVEIGNYGHRLERLSLDLPKLGILSLNIAYKKEDRDGWVKELTPGNGDSGKKNKEAYRLAAKLDINTDLTANYSFDHAEANNIPPPMSLYALRGWKGTLPSAFGPFLGNAIQNAMAPYVATDRPKFITTNTRNGLPLWERSKTDGHSLIFDYKINEKNTLKYIYSKRKMSFSDSLDLDGSGSGSITIIPNVLTWNTMAYGIRDTHYESNSNELQWIGNSDRMNYVFGLYDFKDDGTTLGPQALSIFAIPDLRHDYAVKTDAKAWFAQVDYKLTDRLTATAGIRKTSETKSGWAHHYTTNGFNGALVSDTAVGFYPRTSYSATFDANTPVLALAYRYSDTLNLYGRLAKGFKSGGFSGEANNPVAVTTPYNPEKSSVAELGFKAMYPDLRAQLSGTYFRTKYSDLQITQLIPGTISSFLTNAGKSTYQGIELEGSITVADGWKLQGGYGYLDAKFDEYIDNALNITGQPLIDTASNRLPPYAPKHTLNINVDGRLLKTSLGTLRLIMDYTYSSQVHYYAVNKSLTAHNAGGSYEVGTDSSPPLRNINAKLLLSNILVGGPGEAELSFWIKNLTDEKKPSQGIDFGLFRTTNWQPPRTYGLSFGYKW
ncbi:TonB-dependent receptor [Denitratisoma oestradiolicum]|uniref:TonB-dependent receptor n=1 Tax=Denitratisoma oestradiolicum TaxID=311182 RepID=A0A6S6XQT4_9PROT|nr:TonB-dependent receptor [Denitratisoma oestradiolicum]TWO78837.1 hypothetical protein CBW56_17945 [Denitratisoma oestradiolicum]CAB1368346.1 conserved exported protein of unknown function [Denitratisoma oestradiolicum]